MAFQINNPTLKNIIDFLKNQLSKVATDNDLSIGDTEHWYGRRNGSWSVIQNGGGGGGSTNIGDEVYTDGNNLIIHSASTEMKDFFGQIANDFNDSISYSTGNLVMYNKELYRFTSNYIAGSGDSLTTHAVTTTIDTSLRSIQSNVDLKAPINSPTLTGIPKAPTAAADTNSDQLATTKYVDTAVNKRELLKISIDNFSALPKSYSGGNTIAGSVESDMVPIIMDLSNPAAQTGTWKITTGNASLRIDGPGTNGTGGISGTTNATIYLMKVR